jgi:Fe/S biogenesis protein NfuA
MPEAAPVGSKPSQPEDDGMTETTQQPAVMTVTDPARARILELRADEEGAENLALRVEIAGVAGAEFAYDLSFASVDEADDGDAVYHQGELPVIIPADSVDKMQGAALDLPGDPATAALVLRNPNRPSPLGDFSGAELTGTVDERIRQLFEQRLNPALASHGGYAELVRVEGEKAFITMGGGCQGCAMSALTLVEGIRTAVLDAVPEITEVVDVTDHSAGTNPFYE